MLARCARSRIRTKPALLALLAIAVGCSGSERKGGLDAAMASDGDAGRPSGGGGAPASTGATAGAGTPHQGGTAGGVGASEMPSGTASGSAGTATGGTGGIGGSSGASGSAGIAGNGGQSACPGTKYDLESPPTTLTLSGNLGAHDPAVYVAGGTIYLAATGLIAKTSTNLTSWSAAPNPLSLPSWAASATGASNLWAPDISYFGSSYHLYYSASTFGSKKSCIGQATRAALDSGSWVDQGMVVCSNLGTNDDWNAIDPNVALDDSGLPWLVFGSFWSGIKAVQLDSNGKRADTKLYSLAHHAKGEEGAWVFERCGYYYLFLSSGACCDGAFDYNILVGRSRSVAGPYVDQAGVDMMSGGGTPLVQGNAAWIAPGHNSVFVFGGKTYNVYHALRGSSSGPATLRIAEIAWDESGWPVSGGP